LALYPDLQVQEDARSIREMAERANHIVQSLITFSRRSNVGVIQPDVYSLRVLLTEAVALTESRLQNAGILVEMPEENVYPAEVLVKVDKGQLLQVLVNLLNNAEQALRECPQERRRIIARTGVDISGGWLSLTDTGMGMSEAVRLRIFEPFFTTKDFGEGSGLGLSLCHGIVEAHRGHIAVESQQGNGTTVTLYLPLFGIKEISENNKPL
jgi:two-component system NtrC family sensor kinase